LYWLKITNAENKMKKSLIAYYSRKGQNYLGGNIIDLPVGNTEVIARKIKALNEGDLFEIDTIKTYPKDYTETTKVARDELSKGARPELSTHPENMNGYDTIYLGYPNWWGTFPMVVFTFLESYDFNGKTIIPFCTHEGSGLGNSIRDIKNCCPGANVLDGIAIRGGVVAKADSTIENWLKSLK